MAEKDALIKQVAVRMSSEDIALMTRLQSDLGIRSQSEIIRMALRALAQKHEGIWAKKEPKRRRA